MLFLDITHPLQKRLLEHFLIQTNFVLTQPEPCDTDIPTECILITDTPDSVIARQGGFRQIWLLDLTKPIPTPISEQVLGILSTDVTLDDLQTCIRHVLLGQQYLGEDVVTRFVRPYPGISAVENPPKLTNREQEVFGLMQAGKSLQAIADELFISYYTVESHRAKIQRKLGLSGSFTLIRYAAQSQGLKNSGSPF